MIDFYSVKMLNLLGAHNTYARALSGGHAGSAAGTAAISVPSCSSATDPSRFSSPTLTKAVFLAQHTPRDRSTRTTAAVIGTVSATTHATIRRALGAMCLEQGDDETRRTFRRVRWQR